MRGKIEKIPLEISAHHCRIYIYAYFRRRIFRALVSGSAIFTGAGMFCTVEKHCSIFRRNVDNSNAAAHYPPHRRQILLLDILRYRYHSGLDRDAQFPQKKSRCKTSVPAELCCRITLCRRTHCRMDGDIRLVVAIRCRRTFRGKFSLRRDASGIDNISAAIVEKTVFLQQSLPGRHTPRSAQPLESVQAPSYRKVYQMRQMCQNLPRKFDRLISKHSE